MKSEKLEWSIENANIWDKRRTSPTLVSYKDGVKQNGGIHNVNFNVDRFPLCHVYINMARHVLKKTNTFLRHDVS